LLSDVSPASSCALDIIGVELFTNSSGDDGIALELSQAPAMLAEQSTVTFDIIYPDLSVVTIISSIRPMA